MTTLLVQVRQAGRLSPDSRELLEPVRSPLANVCRSAIHWLSLEVERAYMSYPCKEALLVVVRSLPRFCGVAAGCLSASPRKAKKKCTAIVVQHSSVRPQQQKAVAIAAACGSRSSRERRQKRQASYDNQRTSLRGYAFCSSTRRSTAVWQPI